MDTIMQYAIYLVLGLCVVCLLASIAAFVALERRWQVRAVRVSAEDTAGAPGREGARDELASPLQWQELRHRLEEMQIMADESGRPGPYKNVA
jgi:hypothetical protein